MKGSPEHCAAALHHHFPSKPEFRGSFLHLENIQEDAPVSFPSPSLFPEPETPQEPLEFLSRSWSISAIEVARTQNQASDGAATPAPAAHESSLETAPFVFAPALTSQMVMDRIMEHSLFSAPRRNSHSSGPLICHNSGILAASPPPSPKQLDDPQVSANLDQSGRTDRSIVCLQQQPQQQSRAQLQPRGRSVGRWFKDMKERKKELSRAHNAQLHAAVSMAGVAAAVAAVAAASSAACGGTAGAAADDSASKTSMAVASAASLVAAQCVELAESMGAERDQIAHVVSSAVNVKTAGDIMTLTAAAATALRGAATLKARTLKDHARNHAAVTPYDKHHHFSGDLASSDDGEAEFYTQELLARGCEFLKRSKKGELHWRLVSVHADPNGQVIVKVQSKHIGLRKKRKGVVLEVDPDISAWPGRSLLDNGEQRRYFGLKTPAGMLEFECKSDYEHKLWTEGIAHMLKLSNQQSLALTTTAATAKNSA